MPLPEYTAGGELVKPAGWENWTFVGASIGLSYREALAREGPGSIHNVYIPRQAYEQYAKTGRFPEKTMFVLALYDPEQQVSINRHGYFSGKLLAVEVALKDRERFPEGWAYFDFSRRDTAKAFPKKSCFECHNQHGAEDNVFVQFYPVLRALQAGRR